MNRLRVILNVHAIIPITSSNLPATKGAEQPIAAPLSIILLIVNGMDGCFNSFQESDWPRTKQEHLKFSPRFCHAWFAVRSLL